MWDGMGQGVVLAVFRQRLLELGAGVYREMGTGGERRKGFVEECIIDSLGVVYMAL